MFLIFDGYSIAQLRAAQDYQEKIQEYLSHAEAVLDVATVEILWDQAQDLGTRTPQHPLHIFWTLVMDEIRRRQSDWMENQKQ